MQDGPDTAAGELPGGLAARKAAPDDVNFAGHG
jgi:hypothetical protein